MGVVGAKREDGHLGFAERGTEVFVSLEWVEPAAERLLAGEEEAETFFYLGVG